MVLINDEIVVSELLQHIEDDDDDECIVIVDDVHELHEVLVDDELDVMQQVLLDVQGSEIAVEHDI